MNRGKVAEIVMLVGAGIFLGSIAMAIEELFIRISLLGAVIMFGGVYCGLFYSNTNKDSS